MQTPRIKVTKKGYECNHSVPSQIFFCLYQAAEPLTKYDISKKTGVEWKLIDYHAPKLVEKGLILQEENKYLVNPIFLDEDLWDIYYGVMKLLISYISDRLILQCDNKKTGLLNILQTLPTLFDFEVRDS